MKAIKRTVTIENPNQLILDNLPFQRGQRVEVVLLTEDEPTYRIAEIKELFRVTQALPQAQSITEDEIAAEITAYRKVGRFCKSSGDLQNRPTPHS